MDVDELPQVDPNVDYKTILPIHQKRTIAFINNFINETVSFLNTFAQSCESSLMRFEYKMQKIEASLLILEAQLSSIPNLVESELESKPEEVVSLLPKIGSDDSSKALEDNAVESSSAVESDLPLPKASQDGRYSRFFKMVQVGVPAQAVKLKMEIEGIDPKILDKPNDVIIID